MSILKADPTFVQLISFYQEKKGEVYTDFHELLATLRTEAVQELLSRLDEMPDDFTIKELRELAEFGSDRTGFGPKRIEEHNHTVNFAQRLEGARRRMIDVTPEEE